MFTGVHVLGGVLSLTEGYRGVQNCVGVQMQAEGNKEMLGEYKISGGADVCWDTKVCWG